MDLRVLIAVCVAIAIQWAGCARGVRVIPDGWEKGGWKINSSGGELTLYDIQPALPGRLTDVHAFGINFTGWRPEPGHAISHYTPHFFHQFGIAQGLKWSNTSTSAFMAYHVRYSFLFSVAVACAVLAFLRERYVAKRKSVLIAGPNAVRGFTVSPVPV